MAGTVPLARGGSRRGTRSSRPLAKRAVIVVVLVVVAALVLVWRDPTGIADALRAGASSVGDFVVDTWHRFEAFVTRLVGATTATGLFG
ncbi:MAG: hypothetical protein R2698_08610 [Microthrixaceae bacterium]